MEKHPLAQASAFRQVNWKKKRIKELLIEPDMDSESIKALIITLSKAKAKDLEEKDYLQFVEGQTYYVHGLVEFAKAKDNRERLNVEYGKAFATCASEDEMIEYFDAMD